MMNGRPKIELRRYIEEWLRGSILRRMWVIVVVLGRGVFVERMLGRIAFGGCMVGFR